MKHKHADLIKAWADGAEIERHIKLTTSWAQENTPLWLEDEAYRIKPEAKPDVVKYLVQVSASCWGEVTHGVGYANKIKLTRSGETGELKGAEVIK